MCIRGLKTTDLESINSISRHNNITIDVIGAWWQMVQVKSFIKCSISNELILKHYFINYALNWHGDLINFEDQWLTVPKLRKTLSRIRAIYNVLYKVFMTFSWIVQFRMWTEETNDLIASMLTQNKWNYPCANNHTWNFGCYSKIISEHMAFSYCRPQERDSDNKSEW